MALIDLFPQPKRVTELGATVALGGRRVRLEPPPGAPALAARGIELVEREAVPSAGPAANGGPAYRIVAEIAPDDPSWPEGAGREQAYALELQAEGGRLVAASAVGLFLGCQTVRQLLRGEPETLPALRVDDWPDLPHRGLFVESKWGPDLMTLDDWKTLVDEMVALKLNVLTVGLYSCWVVQYGGAVTEFSMLAFPDRPELAAPKTLRYYSPAKGGWQTLEYLPKMATDDFFGELVGYAKAQNVTVVPHFNSPGHSTLIPRTYPEVSAKDEAGRPIGYGYCLSNPRTYELIFELYDGIIERYLRPHGVDWFQIGMDEVEAYVGVVAERPFEAVEPWCRCPACRDRPRDRQLQEYAVRVAKHLKGQGINRIMIWDDGLRKVDALNDAFVQMLEAEGLREHVVVKWWRYHDPVLVPDPALRLRAWTKPMTGYWSWLFTQSYTANIYPMLLHAHRAGAEGATSYGIYDAAFDRNYACLAQYAWNQTTSEDLYGFKSRYARSRLGSRLDPHLAAEAFEKYDQVFDPMAWTETELASLLYYWHTYPEARRRGSYPRDVFLDLINGHLRTRQAFTRAAASARVARDLFAAANEGAVDPILEQHRVECEKLVGVWEAFSGGCAAIGKYLAAVEGGVAGAAAATVAAESGAALGGARERLLGVMADLERVKTAYLLPQILRDLSILLLYLELLGGELAGLGDRLRGGGVLPPFLDLETNRLDLDPFVSTAAPPPVAAG